MHRAERHWGFPTLGKLKYYLAGAWLVCFVTPFFAPVLLSMFGLQCYWEGYGQKYYYIYEYIPYSSLINIVLHWWNTSDIIRLIGMVLISTAMFLIIADLLTRTKEYPAEVNLDADH